MTVLLTRPDSDSHEIAAVLAEHGIDSMIWPLTRIVPVGDDIDLPARVEALAFTSSNAVKEFSRRSENRALPAYCVGPNSADRARALGFVEVHSAGGDLTALAELLGGAGKTLVFHPRGADVVGSLSAALTGSGTKVVEQILYRAEESLEIPSEVDHALQRGEINVITLWSTRNATILARHLSEHPDWRASEAKAVAISDRAAQPLNLIGFKRLIVAALPNRTEMINKILELVAPDTG